MKSTGFKLRICNFSPPASKMATAGHVGQPFRRDDNRDSIKIGEKADKRTQRNRVSTTLTRFFLPSLFLNHPKNL